VKLNTRFLLFHARPLAGIYSSHVITFSRGSNERFRSSRCNRTGLRWIIGHRRGGIFCIYHLLSQKEEISRPGIHFEALLVIGSRLPLSVMGKDFLELITGQF
jgi:hypothetical protein